MEEKRRELVDLEGKGREEKDQFGAEQKGAHGFELVIRDRLEEGVPLHQGHFLVPIDVAALELSSLFRHRGLELTEGQDAVLVAVELFVCLCEFRLCERASVC